MQVETVSTPTSEYTYEFSDIPFDVVRGVILPFVYEIYRYDFQNDLISEVLDDIIHLKRRRNTKKYNRVLRQLHYIGGTGINIDMEEAYYSIFAFDYNILCFALPHCKLANQKKIDTVLEKVKIMCNAVFIPIPEKDNYYTGRITDCISYFNDGNKFIVNGREFSLYYSDKLRKNYLLVRSDILYAKDCKNYNYIKI